MSWTTSSRHWTTWTCRGRSAPIRIDERDRDDDPMQDEDGPWPGKDASLRLSVATSRTSFRHPADPLSLWPRDARTYELEGLSAVAPDVYARLIRFFAFATGGILVCLVVRHWRRVPLTPDPWDGQLGPDLGGDPDEPTAMNVLCTSCLEANVPGADFCVRCGNPVGDTTALDPLKRIYAQGWVYRRAASSPYRLLIVVGMWLIYLPFVLGMLFPLVFFTPVEKESVLSVVAALAVTVVGAGTLLRVTRNYVRHRRACRAAQGAGA